MKVWKSFCDKRENRRGAPFLHILGGGGAMNLKVEVQRARKGAFGRNRGVSFMELFDELLIFLRLTTAFVYFASSA